MASKKQSRSTSRESAAPAPRLDDAFSQAVHDLRRPQAAFPNVSARWLVAAAGVAVAAALVCAWLTLCLLYWQGSWQLLYHPSAAIEQTPAGLAYEPVKFAATETGATQLTGWWIPAAGNADGAEKFAVLYLHGADGNLGDTSPAIVVLHQAGLAVFAFDYRGYGQSAASRPSEKTLRQDAEWALTWLTLTRHIAPKTIIVMGSGLGADIAAELAADHSELAGVVLDEPPANALKPIFADTRSKLVPAHWFAEDRYDLSGTAGRLGIPSLWLMPEGQAAVPAYASARAGGSSAALASPVFSDARLEDVLRRWMAGLQG